MATINFILSVFSRRSAKYKITVISSTNNCKEFLKDKSVKYFIKQKADQNYNKFNGAPKQKYDQYSDLKSWFEIEIQKSQFKFTLHGKSGYSNYDTANFEFTCKSGEIEFMKYSHS